MIDGGGAIVNTVLVVIIVMVMVYMKKMMAILEKETGKRTREGRRGAVETQRRRGRFKKPSLITSTFRY